MTDTFDAYLRRLLPALSGSMRLEPVSGGRSNPTFFVSYENRRLVLRKQPPGPLLPSAHAIDREYRVMQALAGSGVPVPRLLAFVDDADIAGTPFYLMERIEGRVFDDCALPGVSPADRRAMYLDMAQTLARLHSVDWVTAGLTGYGKVGSYFERQISRWTRQAKLGRTGPSADVAYLAEWLGTHVPAHDTTAISHGDFRIGNLIFHSQEPRVVAVLDWELSTLGHPLADLAFSALAWRQTSPQCRGIRGTDIRALGIPGEEEYLACYYANVTFPERAEAFHYVFSLFRLLVIFSGIAERGASSIKGDTVTAPPEQLASDFARMAVELIGA